MFKYLRRDGDPKMSLYQVAKRQFSEWSEEKKQAKEQVSKEEFKTLAFWLKKYHMGMFFQPLISRETAKIKLTLHNRPLVLEFRQNQSDLYILRENFIQNIYDFDYESIVPNVKSVVDLGANIGLTSLYFQNRFPNAKVVCVEPVSHNVEMIKKNASNNNFSWGVETAAIQSSVGSVTLYPNEWWSSSTVNKDIADKRQSNEGRVEYNHKLPPEEVEAIPVDVVFDRHNMDIVDILKMDIEGAEEPAILDNPKWFQRVRILIVEIHDKYVDRKKITKALLDAGFEGIVGRKGPTNVFINRRLENGK
ncbi:FkbM family methyltransferase [Aureispira anguillae]|uniref:FkbM family methyltransferase n=1 Tax=Aureispira anguillae TaxID=2864201 RepID=A0A916DR44_9BACT|nr:FkbM family methyltransferase [Aureispira anguillae]BDS11589.1 FkbM family methyltransferase [Aureispira anguillae]